VVVLNGYSDVSALEYEVFGELSFEVLLPFLRAFWQLDSGD
jgi:hypothetical protein